MSNKVGLLGYPITHSLSPKIHQSGFDAQHLDWTYELFQFSPEEFEVEIEKLKKSGVRGFNITAPYKQTIVPYLDECDAVSSLLGAVNTAFLDEDNHWIGTNTDVIGLRRVLDEIGVEQQSIDHVTMFGNGGVARAVLSVMNDLKIKTISIFGRDQRKSLALIEIFSGKYPGWKEIQTREINAQVLQEELWNSQLLINTTTVGMHHNEMKSLFSGNIIIPPTTRYLDLVYDPLETQMMKEVKKAGGSAWNGIDMLIYQAAASYQIWTGMEAPINVMKEAVLRRIT
jgi:shikimate dehydrogenase